MTDYRNYTTEDLLTDALFRAWVLNADPEATAFWHYWLVDNPDRSERVEAARALLLAMQEKRQTVSDEELGKIVEATLGRLGNADVTEKPSSRRIYFILSRIAAAIVLVAGLGWLVHKFPGGSSSNVISKQSTSDEIRTERKNNTDKPMTVLLGDKSTVILQPGSQLSFSPAMEKASKRIVYLDGEGFFDVVKDPAHPFFVYTNQLVTRVLGTSFRVVAYNREKQASVSVVTGKVTVFAKKDLEKTDRVANPPASGDVVLSPNEQATFTQNAAKLTKSKIEGLVTLYHSPEFSFDETPVTEVFTALEKAYGIDIKYEPEKIDGYLLTATFADMSLHDELQLICRIIKGNYHIEEGKVIIETGP
ncbi:FecR family protein [Dyadobacter luticola]|nr:FecR family protein [Dyadobacter luticola]